MEEQVSIERATACVDGARRGSVRGSARSRGERRRTVSVGVVRGVLALGEHGWVVDNDSEVRLLEALRGERGARQRLWALAAVLDAGLVEAGNLRWLNGRLSAIAAVERPEMVCRVWVADELLGAVAYVCVCVNDERFSRWLGFALSARLDANLVRGLLQGPGWESRFLPGRLYWRGFDRETHWISEMPESFWDRVRAHGDERLRAVAVASDPAARPRVLESLADEHRGVPEVLDLVAANPRTPTRVLRRLAGYSFGWERIGLRVAQNRSATVGLLAELAKSRDWESRYVAAWHPRVSASALRRLASDESFEVRAAVARAEAAPASVLEALASDRDVSVRRNVAWNPSTHRAVLEVLLEDRLADVRAAAVANENTPVELAASRARDRALRVRRQVAACRGIGAEVLTALAEDSKEAVRREVALNVQTPREVLALLAGDSCLAVRAGVAYNRSASPDTLTMLASEEDRWLRARVALNKSTPEALLAVLAADVELYVRSEVAENAAAPADLLSTLAADDDWFVRAGVSSNTAAPSDLFGVLAQDRDPHVRRYLCENDEAPLPLVDALRSDRAYMVRAAATAACERRRAQTAPNTASRRR